MAWPDEEGRHWAQAKVDDANKKEIEGALCTLISPNDDGDLDVLGSGFAIYAGSDKALCLGAAHSFEEVKRRQRHRMGIDYSRMPADFHPHGPEYVDLDSVRAVFLCNGDLLICDIDQYNSIANYDVAAFTVVAPDGKKPFAAHFGIDLGALRDGEEVMVIAHHLTLERQPPVGEETARGIIQRRLDLRGGGVTEAILGLTGVPGQSFVARTTIPVYGGMSGSPVVRTIGPSRKIVACGVVSSDLSKPEAFQSFLVAGRSAVSQLWPAMGLGLNVERPPEARSYVSLGELASSGAFDNCSDRVAVEVRHTQQATEITYVDERGAVPFRAQLRTTPHPRVPPQRE
jgi:hypothetical protein